MGILFFTSAISCLAAYIYRKTKGWRRLKPVPGPLGPATSYFIGALPHSGLGGVELQPPPYNNCPPWELNVHDQDALLEALRSTEELIDAYRRLAPKHPMTARPYLADCLINKSGICFYLGRPEETLAPGLEAVTIYREVCAAEPTSLFTSRLAESLRNLGGIYGRANQGQESLKALEESVELLRGLLEKEPNEAPNGAMRRRNMSWTGAAVREQTSTAANLYLSDLAASLNDLGCCHYQLGRGREALNCFEESVGLRRELALNNDVQALNQLTRGLRTLGSVSGKLGRHRVALSTREEAAEIQQKAAEIR